MLVNCLYAVSSQEIDDNSGWDYQHARYTLWLHTGDTGILLKSDFFYPIAWDVSKQHLQTNTCRQQLYQNTGSRKMFKKCPHVDSVTNMGSFKILTSTKLTMLKAIWRYGPSPKVHDNRSFVVLSPTVTIKRVKVWHLSFKIKRDILFTWNAFFGHWNVDNYIIPRWPVTRFLQFCTSVLRLTISVE